MPRRRTFLPRARADLNQGAVVDALRKVGAQVLNLTAVGDGVPDLLVLFRGKVFFLEVKNPQTAYGRRGLNPRQRHWAQWWQGPPPEVVTSGADALRAIGAVR